MAKYLYQSTYSEEGLRGLLKEGGSKRREAVKKAVEAAGGRLEAYYFAFGETDVYNIVELPDNMSAAAGSMLVTASGAGTVKTVVLMTPEEMDKATQMANQLAGGYRPPGR